MHNYTPHIAARVRLSYAPSNRSGLVGVARRAEGADRWTEARRIYRPRYTGPDRLGHIPPTYPPRVLHPNLHRHSFPRILLLSLHASAAASPHWMPAARVTVPRAHMLCSCRFALPPHPPSEPHAVFRVLWLCGQPTVPTRYPPMAYPPVAYRSVRRARAWYARRLGLVAVWLLRVPCSDRACSAVLRAVLCIPPIVPTAHPLVCVRVGVVAARAVFCCVACCVLCIPPVARALRLCGRVLCALGCLLIASVWLLLLVGEPFCPSRARAWHARRVGLIAARGVAVPCVPLARVCIASADCLCGWCLFRRVSGWSAAWCARVQRAAVCVSVACVCAVVCVPCELVAAVWRAAPDLPCPVCLSLARVVVCMLCSLMLHAACRAGVPCQVRHALSVCVVVCVPLRCAALCAPACRARVAWLGVGAGA